MKIRLHDVARRRGRARVAAAAVAASACTVALACRAGGAGPPREPDPAPVDGHDRVESADGVSIFTRWYGDGSPVVLLAGGPGFSGDYLEPLAVRLAATHRVALPDQRGTGRSAINPWDPGRITISGSIGDIDALRARAGADRVTLVGHSWGGVLAMAYAVEHPDRVRALVLVGSGGLSAEFHGDYSMNIVQRLLPEERTALAEAQRGLVADPEGALLDMMRITAPAMLTDRDLGRRLADETLGPATLTPAVTLAMQPWLATYDLGDRVAGVQAPVLVVLGRDDPVGEPTSRAIAEAFPHGRLEIIEGAAHWPFLEQPAEFDRIVTRFLADHAGD